MDDFSWPKCWLFFPYLISHLKLFQYLGLGHSQGVSQTSSPSPTFSSALLYMQTNSEGHYWIFLEEGTTKCNGAVVPLKNEFIFLIIFDMLWPFASSFRVDSNHPWRFFYIRGDGWMRKLINFKASCGNLQWKIPPSEDYSAEYRTEVWSVHSSILFIPA